MFRITQLGFFFPFPSFFLNWENTACHSYGFSKAVGSSLTGAPSSQLGYSEHKGRREEPIGQSAFPVLKPGRWVWCCASPGKGIHPHTSHKPGPSWVSGSLISDTMNTICPCGIVCSGDFLGRFPEPGPEHQPMGKPAKRDAGGISSIRKRLIVLEKQKLPLSFQSAPSAGDRVGSQHLQPQLQESHHSLPASLGSHTQVSTQ